MNKRFRVVFLIIFVMVFISVLVACSDPEGDIVLPSKVVVTFNSNGGSEVPPITIDENTALTLPANPMREGYTFDGWYLDEETITAFDSTGTIPSNITIYAKWKENAKYTVTFVGGDGATGTAPTMESQYAGASITLPVNTFTKENHAFAGWLIGTGIYQPNDNYEVSAQNVTFTAKWTENAKYTVTFVGGDGAIGTAPTMESQYAGASITLPANVFTKTNYKFIGWKDGTKNKYQPDDSYEVGVQNVTFTAIWDYNGQVEYSLSEDRASYCASSYKLGITDAIIEATYNGLPVTEIEGSAFEGCSTLTSVIIPSSVKSINSYAFYGCEILEAVTFESDSELDSIYSCAFGECYALTSITLPDSLKTIRDFAFRDCTSLSTIIVSENSQLTDIIYTAFQNTAFFSNLENEVAYIGHVAVSYVGGMPNDTTITFREGTKIISNLALSGFKQLVEIVIPDSLMCIASHAFTGCTSLSTITMSENNRLQKIEETAFHNTAFFNSSASGLIYIGKVAYAYKDIMPENTEIILDDGTIGIANDAFRYYTELTGITLPSSLKNIGAYAFSDCTGLNNIVYCGTREQWDAVEKAKDWDYLSTISSVTCTDDIITNYDVTFLAGEGASDYAPELFAKFAGDTFELPENYFYHNGYIFSGWSDGTNVYQYCDSYVMPDEPVTFTATWDVNVIYEIDEYNEAYYVSGYTTGVTDAIIEASYRGLPVVGILDSAFENYDSLITVTISDNIRIIGKYAFRNCSSLTSVICNYNTELRTIDVEAFADCTALREIIIPCSWSGYDYVDVNAFIGCCRLVHIINFSEINFEFFNNPGMEIYTDYSEFETTFSTDSDGVVTFTVGEVVYFFDYIGSETTLDLSGKGITAIYQAALYNNDTVQEVIIPDSIVDIGYYAFYNTAYFNAMPDGLVYIGKVAYVFKGTVPADSIITLKEGTVSIADRAFYYRTGLTKIIIPVSVTNIGEKAFDECTKLESIVFNGTKAQWIAITKGLDWNKKVAATTVNCTDSDIGGYSVTFFVDENADDLTPVMPIQLEGAKFVLPENIYYLDGYIFGGWSYGSKVYQSDDTFVMPSDDVEFIAIYNPNVRYEYDYDHDTYYVAGYTPGVNNAIIEEMYDGSYVTAIACDAFVNCTSLKTIYISNTIRYIEENAFLGCTSLEKVTFEQDSEMQELGDYVFNFCSSLCEITIPYSVYENYDFVSSDIFYGCDRLVHITNLSGVNIEIPDNPNIEIRTDENTDFENILAHDSDGIVTYTVGTEVYLLGYFGNETMLDLSGKGITAIYANAFSENAFLATVILPNTLTSIGDNGFFCCSGLTSITIPSSVTSIGDDAFYGCNKLVQITNLSEIDIELPDNLRLEIRTDEDTDFLNALVTDSDGMTIYTVGTEVYCIGYSGNETTLDLSGKGITAIYANAFYQNTSIHVANIPDSVTSIGAYAFYQCTALTTINFDENSQLLDIGEYAFYKTALTTIAIPSSAISIVDYAFYQCTELAAVTFGTGSQLLSIGDSAFGNTAITKLAIPDSVTRIGDNAFSDCIELETVTFTAKNQLEYIGYLAFSNTIWHTNLSDGLTYIGKVAYAYVGTMPENSDITIKEGTRSISANAFIGYAQLISITIPSSVTSIGDYAFFNCIGLETVTFAANSELMEIGEYAFSGCVKLAEIITPSSVTRIGINAFQQCIALMSITLPFVSSDIITDTDEYQYPFGFLFGTKRFEDCIMVIQTYYENSTTPLRSKTYYIPAYLKTVVITGGTQFVSGSFMNCTMLTSITIPSTVTSIANDAFSGCTGLTTINFTGTMAEWNAIEKGTTWNENTGAYTVVCLDGTITK